ncbi:maleylacetate reductase [Burkholderia sp. ABCPW 11]|uniref:maleylacetate reductase n=1 Tax=Burkholderia sp. ABCPW 11 TaxID=1637859 RepID=UPI00075772B6|nr:maleylacetate reductase [Burkholderia sp. ABCPW 11]KVD46828.1 maleylacetate reductase [Burkholderia sp. ABCPW 11]
MEAFTYQTQPARVIFGVGTVERLIEEADRLGRRRLLVLCTASQVSLERRVLAGLGSRAVGAFTDAKRHTPAEVTERALAEVRALNADGIVSVGGGSVIGLGKALAFRTDLPQIVVPTTYAGSEMTPILHETRDGVKTTQRSSKVLPEVVIYDVDLTLSLSLTLSVLSAFDALAHAVESLYAPDGNPVVSMMAEEGVRVIARSLPHLMTNPQNASVRSDLLFGAWLCACCLGTVTMGLHHEMCRVLGGLYDLPHAQIHAIVLPHVLEFNSRAAPTAMSRLSHALNASDSVGRILELQRACSVPVALRDIGMPREGIERAVEQLMANPCANPRSLGADAVTMLLERAWAGSRIQRSAV